MNSRFCATSSLLFVQIVIIYNKIAHLTSKQLNFSSLHFVQMQIKGLLIGSIWFDLIWFEIKGFALILQPQKKPGFPLNCWARVLCTQVTQFVLERRKEKRFPLPWQNMRFAYYCSWVGKSKTQQIDPTKKNCLLCNFLMVEHKLYVLIWICKEISCCCCRMNIMMDLFLIALSARFEM